MSRSVTASAAARAHALRAPAPIRWALGASQTVAPELAAWLGERLFFTPPRHPLPAEAEALLRRGRRFELTVDGRRVTGWRWGRGPLVYLMHGWGGRGGRLAAFVSPLVAQGHAVVAFDAPGHGGSRLAMSSMPEFARALLAVADLCGPAHAVIGHSLGAAASALAVTQGLVTRRLVLIAPPADPAGFLVPFAGALGLTPEVMARLQSRSEQRLRFRWTDLDLRRMQPTVPLPLLVVHDRDDRTVPFENGAAVAASWKGRLLETSGMGHAGVLRHPDVVRAVHSFVTEEEDGVPPQPLNEGSGLEWSLFHPAARV